jgi:hypothetical protein
MELRALDDLQNNVRKGKGPLNPETGVSVGGEKGEVASREAPHQSITL